MASPTKQVAMISSAVKWRQWLRLVRKIKGHGECKWLSIASVALTNSKLWLLPLLLLSLGMQPRRCLPGSAFSQLSLAGRAGIK